MKRLSKYIFNRMPAASAGTSEKMASKVTNCVIHDQNKYPNIRALEYCVTCAIGMCYMCSNHHSDLHHTIDWGYDIFKHLEAPHNTDNELFNTGYRTTLDLEELKCPCGSLIKNSKYSTMCAVCGSWTCSARCHEEYIQSKGKCIFIRNFLRNEETSNIQGMRNILYTNVKAMHRDNKPEHTPCARVSPKFMKASIGPHKGTITVQRGYRQYGQPCEETLKSIVEIVDKEDDQSFIHHRDRLCHCS